MKHRKTTSCITAVIVLILNAAFYLGLFAGALWIVKKMFF